MVWRCSWPARSTPPRWEDELPGRRVLVEHRDPQVRAVLERVLEEHGYGVLTCAGPEGTQEPPGCPVLRDEACPAVAGADVVVSALDARHPWSDRVAEQIACVHPEVPVVVDHRLRASTAVDGAGTHRFYRTTVAPLVRRLYDVLFLTGT